MSSSTFFTSQKEQSSVKTALVSKYFKAWSDIMLKQTEKRAMNQVAYVDLFSGPGAYADGQKSTPILVLERAIQDPKLRNRLITVFNDNNAQHVASLSAAIDRLDGVSSLIHHPLVTNLEVRRDTFNYLESLHQCPSLFFIDPFGYKALSIDLITSSIRNWGCESILFFNYNRINGAINNQAVQDHVRVLYGADHFDHLRAQLRTGLTPEERESIILDEFMRALKNRGGRFVLPFKFRDDRGTRTSHYVLFVNKHFLGYSIMKDIMFGESSSDQEVRHFEWAPSPSSRLVQLSLLPDLSSPSNVYSIGMLKRFLLEVCQGQSPSVRQIYELHSVDTPYTERNFKTAIRELEAEGTVSISTPASRRQKKNGVVTLADGLIVTFP